LAVQQGLAGHVKNRIILDKLHCCTVL